MKIYTRTGDSGETGLFDGTRVPKSDPRVAAYGDVDELNAWLGLVAASTADEQMRAILEQVQKDLFGLGARLADPAHRIAGRVTSKDVQAAASAGAAESGVRTCGGRNVSPSGQSSSRRGVTSITERSKNNGKATRAL